MDIRLVGDEVRAATRTRYAVKVGGKAGSVTHTQYRILEAFRSGGGCADLRGMLADTSYRHHISRLRRELRNINPAFDDNSIVSVHLHVAREEDSAGMYVTSLIISDSQ